MLINTVTPKNTETVTETYTVSTINSYTNLYKNWYKITKITAEWNVTFGGSKQMYLRLHTTNSDSSWMYWYVFDYVNSTHRWELQLRSWNNWVNKHYWANNSLSNANTFKIEFLLDGASITINNTTTQITYDSEESNRIAEVFTSSTPYFYTAQYNSLSSWANTITVEYESI